MYIRLAECFIISILVIVTTLLNYLSLLNRCCYPGRAFPRVATLPGPQASRAFLPLFHPAHHAITAVLPQPHHQTGDGGGGGGGGERRLEMKNAKNNGGLT